MVETSMMSSSGSGCILGLLALRLVSATGVPFLFFTLLRDISDSSICAAGVGSRLRRVIGLDSPVRSGIVVVRLEGRLLGLCEPLGATDCTVTLMRASPVSMRKDLEGDPRGPGVPEECAIDGATLRRV